MRLFAALAFASLSAFAASDAAYRPQHAVQGEIRIWGSPEDGDLIKRWDEGFHKFHPQAHLVSSLHGPESTMAGIYTGAAEIAFVGRELREPVEDMAFQWVRLYKASTIEIANAGLSAERVAANLAVFVHRDNPVAGLTLAQLDAVFGAEHKKSRAPAKTWGDLGVAGEWRDQPIHVLAPRVDSVPALFFRKTVLGGSFKWNESLREFDSGRAMLAELAADPAAIAYAPMADANDGVRAVPLAAAASAPFVALTSATAADRSYPLARVVIVAYDRAPGKPLDPRVREFLRFVLSGEGQSAISADAAYVPLLPHDARVQRAKLD